MTVSWLGNTSLVPSGTTTTRGANCLSRCLISTVWPRALERRPSTYTYASPRDWPAPVFTRPVTVAASCPDPPLPGAAPSPPAAVLGITTYGDEGGGNEEDR